MLVLWSCVAGHAAAWCGHTTGHPMHVPSVCQLVTLSVSHSVLMYECEPCKGIPAVRPLARAAATSNNSTHVNISLSALCRVWRLAIPLMINNIAGYALSIVGAIYIGRLGSLPLSASVLANSLYNCTGLSLALGLSAGMETLCGQVSKKDRSRWHESALASAELGQESRPDSLFGLVPCSMHSNQLHCLGCQRDTGKRGTQPRFLHVMLHNSVLPARLAAAASR
jgi:hypothetical protein